MYPTRKILVSAGVVGVILVGGASIAASASEGRLRQVSEEARLMVVKNAPQQGSADPQDQSGGGQDHAAEPQSQGEQEQGQGDQQRQSDQQGQDDQQRQSDQQGQGDQQQDGDVVSHESGADPSQVEEYWTPDRMDGAEPYPLPEIDTREGD